MPDTHTHGLDHVFIPQNLPEFVAKDKVALIMWDMQKGLAGRALHVENIKQNAARLLSAADQSSIPVFWSRHVLPPLHMINGPFLRFLMKKQKVDHPSQLKDTMQEGMEETQFLDGLAPAPHHIVLQKSQPSLFIDTPLDMRLRTLGIKTLVIAGVATDIGVEFTCRHAAALGYFTVVPEDACGSYTDIAHTRSLDFLRSWTTPVVRTDEILDIWSI